MTDIDRIKYLKDYLSDDITFCMEDNCPNTDCFRNSKNIKTKGPHSFADFRATRYCPSYYKDVT